MPDRRVDERRCSWSSSLFFVYVAVTMVMIGCVRFDLAEDSLINPDDPPTSLDGASIESGVVPMESGAEIAITTLFHSQPRQIIIYCGGNNFRMQAAGGRIARSLGQSYDLVLFDYPGYGDSTGRATVASIIEATLAVHDYAEAEGWFRDRQVIGYGFSMGGFAVSELARHRALDAVVLESTAPSVAAWSRTFVPWWAKPFVSIDVAKPLVSLNNVEALAQVGYPVLVLAGGKDVEAPDRLSRHLYGELLERGVDVQFVLFPSARHGEIMNSPEFTPAFARFMSIVSS